MKENQPLDLLFIIAESVIGKSKCISGFNRMKPLKYKNANDEHPIIYYERLKFSSMDLAEKYCESISKDMLRLYIYGVNSVDSKLIDYTIIMHNIDNDESRTIYSTIPDIKKINGRMYDHNYNGSKFVIDCSNKKLNFMGIIFKHK